MRILVGKKIVRKSRKRVASPMYGSGMKKDTRCYGKLTAESLRKVQEALPYNVDMLDGTLHCDTCHSPQLSAVPDGSGGFKPSVHDPYKPPRPPARKRNPFPKSPRR
jgi:hypothetical protein